MEHVDRSPTAIIGAVKVGQVKAGVVRCGRRADLKPGVDDAQASVVTELLGTLQLLHEVLDIQRWKRRDPHRPSGTEVDRQVRDRRVTVRKS